jgi:hypothetical protein
MTILDTILAIHHDPKQLVVSEHPLTDAQVNIPILGRFVEEDKHAWWIKHNGEYLLYCTKESKALPGDNGDPRHLERMLAEAWGRYTRKTINGNVDFGHRC